jgi:hypothetical protein
MQMFMRGVVAIGMMMMALWVGGCPAPATLCDLSTAPVTDDEAAQGQGSGVRSDDVTLRGTSSWRAEPVTNLVVGDMSFEGFTTDENGADVLELISNAAFPLCIRLGERDATNGNATVPPAFVTNATNQGVLVLTDNRDGALGGRFAVDFDGMTVSDGVFRASQRGEQ